MNTIENIETDQTPPRGTKRPSMPKHPERYEKVTRIMPVVLLDESDGSRSADIMTGEAMDRWLPIIGPTAMLLVRYLADREGDDYLDPGIVASALGVGLGRMWKALDRLERYDLAEPIIDGITCIVEIPQNWPLD